MNAGLHRSHVAEPTELRRDEEDVERRRRLDMGISWTAHELRAPLLGVRAAVEVVANDPGVDPRRAEILRRALAELERLAVTTEAVLGWVAGTRALDRRDTDVSQLVEQAVDSCRLAGGDGFVVDLRGLEPPIARVDAEHVRVAIANLLRNARAYADPGSTVEVEVSRDGDAVTVSVRNRGPVIPLADRERIFEPFVRSAASTSTPGTGLGLFITRQVVEAHGGRVSVDSEASATTFRVVLPSSEEALARAS
jgi:signal transduction histidine kinase